MPPQSQLNTGIIARRADAVRPRRDGNKRTLIVSGIARSGASLLAALLKAAGVFMGDFLHDVHNEDAQIVELLRRRDMDVLKQLIRERNQRHALWGFKLPNLHMHLRYGELALFRNPHLLLICRDPVAVAVRNVLSEQNGELQALAHAATALHSLAEFARLGNCPTLFVSYEKALAFPNLMLDSLGDFCGLEFDMATRARLLLEVQPNRPNYLSGASSTFEGRIDGLMNGQLYGWCCQVGRLEPVKLDLYADDRLLESVLADRFRDDLASLGVGNGCHGFFVHLDHHQLPPQAVIRMKIANRVLELENSGTRLGAFEEAAGTA